MTPPDYESRRIDGLLSAVSALQAGERNAEKEAKAIREEIRASEARLSGRIAELGQEVEKVEKTCEDFRREVRTGWEHDRKAREERVAKEQELSKGRRVLMICATIGFAATFLASIVSALVTVFGT